MSPNEPRMVREVQKDTRYSSYLQLCNKSVGSDHIQGCHAKDFIGVVDSMFLEHLRGDWDGGVNLKSTRDGHNWPCIQRAKPCSKTTIFLPDRPQVQSTKLKRPDNSVYRQVSLGDGTRHSEWTSYYIKSASCPFHVNCRRHSSPWRPLSL